MSRKPPKNIEPEEDALFRDAAAGARPVTTRRMHLRRAPPAANARFRRRDEAEVLRESLRTDPAWLEIETGEEMVFRRPEVSASVLRRLRQGRYAVKAELDLHGMTSNQARLELRVFLAECADAGIHCVRIVHGKGLRSGQRGPVLKASVNRWLRLWDGVLAFVSAPARDGGTGAVYVLLRH
jgi:DNA-nicking Smr family endonuclease